MNIVRLVKKAKRGNKEALLQLIMAEKDDYYRLALTYLGNEHDAMDAMEEMIVILYEKINQLKKEEAFYSWSKTILVNCSKTLLRKQKRLMLVDEWESTTEFGQVLSSDPYLNSAHILDLQMLFVHLNDNQKEAIQLKYFHDLDYETIASITNVSVGTVKSRVFQGLKKLREYYGGDVGE
ncbi:sigma-70 family RNA polymerase sigma factor [Fredinandcohnia quinoae]|uniref:Sigma-70 family RNA polymerase sigma factor n=1 Tax=Fredinandcohnia quinoae TaxID=2918902 RepID=A0AAW5E489_9BACI|nr:sigma-70 family RNA polymerase sigma factor [Fredinandcohnia sp. SECRCQ15]MCH1624146.1 sigma-70 family RNA polymerase sigma factor [Fredinandcohnia sp. SECRCQ15]